MTDPKKNKPAELNEDQLSKISGGEAEQTVLQPKRFKRCAADPTHVYVEVLDACPVCGTKEFIYA